MGRALRLWGMVVLLVAVLGCAERAEAREAEGRGGGMAALEARIEARDSELARAVEEARVVGARLEEAQSRVDGVRARANELRAQTRQLRARHTSQRRAFAAAKERYRERARAAYRGRDLSGISFLMERLLGISGGNGSADLRVLRSLLDGGDALAAYEDQRRMLRDTLRQVSQKRSAYAEVLRREAQMAGEFRSQERELRRVVRRIGEQKTRAQARLRDLRAAERARILRTKPATSSVRITPGLASSDEPGAGFGDAERIGQAEGELEIARQEIVARPVENLPEEGYMALYRRAAAQYGFGADWYVLAAVGKVESNHGQEMGPSVSGAMGPMQFLPSTWETAGVDGNGDGVANIMDPEDAIPAAARYLASGGAPGDWYAALYTYNRADWYVMEVLAVAEGYRRLAGDDDAGPYL